MLGYCMIDILSCGHPEYLGAGIYLAPGFEDTAADM
jgi:hypothetical protein